MVSQKSWAMITNLRNLGVKSKYQFFPESWQRRVHFVPHDCNIASLKLVVGIPFPVNTMHGLSQLSREVAVEVIRPPGPPGIWHGCCCAGQRSRSRAGIQACASMWWYRAFFRNIIKNKCTQQARAPDSHLSNSARILNPKNIHKVLRVFLHRTCSHAFSCRVDTIEHTHAMHSWHRNQPQYVVNTRFSRALGLSQNVHISHNDHLNLTDNYRGMIRRRGSVSVMEAATITLILKRNTTTEKGDWVIGFVWYVSGDLVEINNTNQIDSTTPSKSPIESMYLKLARKQSCQDLTSGNWLCIQRWINREQRAQGICTPKYAPFQTFKRWLQKMTRTNLQNEQVTPRWCRETTHLTDSTLATRALDSHLVLVLACNDETGRKRVYTTY